MARLGELLVAASLLTIEQVEQALRAQVLWGGRIGTNLIELGFLDLDELSRALGRQHHQPAALARHFDKVDRELQQLLSPDVAERFSVVPLVRVGPERKVVIASAMPLGTKALAIIADELAVAPTHLIPSIAAELRIRYQLERIYKIPRSARFMRSPGKSVPEFPRFEIDVEESQVDVPPLDIALPTDTRELEIYQAPTAESPAPAPVADEDDDLTIPVIVDRPPERSGEEVIEDLDDLSAHAQLDDDDLAVPAEVEETPSGKERRKYVRTIADAPTSESERAALGRINLRKVMVTPTARPAGLTLGEATRAIRRGTDRDAVADLVIDTLFRFAPSCDAALMLVVRGDVAIAWKSFVRSGATPPEMAVPLHQGGLVPRVVASNCSARSPATDLTPIDQLLMVSLGQQTGELVAVPVSISGRVMCVLAMVTEPGAQITSAESIAVAAGAAFARLMRNASR